MDKDVSIELLHDQKSFNEEREGFSRLSFAVAKEELVRFEMLKPKIFKDGNEWCVLYGDNIQDGIAGFGATPNKALFDWNGAWDREI